MNRTPSQPQEKPSPGKNRQPSPSREDPERREPVNPGRTSDDELPKPGAPVPD